MFKYALLAILFLNSSAFAGDNGGGQLICASASGRTVVKGGAGVESDNGSGFANLVYEIDGKGIDLKTDLAVAPGVYLYDLVKYEKSGSYSVQLIRIQASDFSDAAETYVSRELIFALKSKGKIKESSQDVFKFNAVIPSDTTVDPRQTTALTGEIQRFNKDIDVECTLDLTL